MKNDGGTAAHDAATTLNALTQDELIKEIRRRLGLTSARRVGYHHAEVVRLLLDMGGGLHEVSAIYKALLDSNRAMVMSQLYRVLKVLEEAKVVESHWANLEGRPRRVFGVAGRVDRDALHKSGDFCKHCGAPLHRH